MGETVTAAADLLGVVACVTSRLCHDLAGLVASLSGTLEMALEDGGDAEAAVLAREAATVLAARLKLFRASWGGGDLEQATLGALAEGLPGRAKLRLELDGLDGALGDDGKRLALCLLLAGGAGLPFGGTIIGGMVAGGGFSLCLAGRQAAWPPGLGDGAGAALDGGGPRGLASPLAAIVGAGLGWRLAVEGCVVTAMPG